MSQVDKVLGQDKTQNNQLSEERKEKKTLVGVISNCTYAKNGDKKVSQQFY